MDNILRNVHGSARESKLGFTEKITVTVESPGMVPWLLLHQNSIVLLNDTDCVHLKKNETHDYIHV